jgi:Glutamyl-tRNAGlu reductase, N-terminal domain
MLTTDCLHLLTIDFDSAPSLVREAFAFSTEEQRQLLVTAGKDGIPLVLLCNARSFHMVSTSQNHVRAFRPALARVHERTHAIQGSRAVPVRVTRGSDAGRQFLRHATPFGQQESEAQEFLSDMHAAAILSTECAAFSAELSALFRMTEHAAERVRRETRLGRPGSHEAELELEALAAERIVEEELLAWQSSHPELRASVRPPISERDIDLFSAEEPQSVVRLRVARVLTKLRTA